MFGNDDKRFKFVYKQNVNGLYFRILKDKETGICYLISPDGGITPLLDSNGNPQKMQSLTKRRSPEKSDGRLFIVLRLKSFELRMSRKAAKEELSLLPPPCNLKKGCPKRLNKRPYTFLLQV